MPEAPPIPHGGTRPKPPEELRSPVLRVHGAAVAEACVTRIYATWPELVERYGERGRRLTAEDNHWHLNFLDVAALLRDDAHFDRYADWLVGFLGPRGLGPHHVAGAFRFLADALAARPVTAEHEAHRGVLVGLLRRTAGRIQPESADGPGSPATASGSTRS